MPASVSVSPGLVLAPAQERVLAVGELGTVSGPPGSGKTTALCAYAAACQERGVRPLIVASHPSGCAALAEALGRLGRDPQQFSIATLPEHVAAWMRSEYVSAGVSPILWVGGMGAMRAIVTRAATGLLDMTWPIFGRSDVNLDLPYLNRPETFLDEAASLFALLLRSRISPEEFEEGCTRGLAAFYGEQTERALVLLADKALRQVASQRGRAALRASASSLSIQRKAERDIAALLANLYREYHRAASAFAFRSPDDLIDAAMRWLASDEQSSARIARSIGALVVDDAEDSEPALGALIALLRRHHPFPVLLGGWEAARIDGFEGRRSAMSSFAQAERIELPPRDSRAASQVVRRFEDEGAEAAWLAQTIVDLISSGTAPHEIAVISRNADAAAFYARRLQAAGLPVVMPVSKLQRALEVGDLLALGAVVDDPFDQAHLLRVLSAPMVGLSDADLRLLCREPVERRQLSLDVGGAASPEPTRSSPPPGTLARNVLDGAADELVSESARSTVTSLRDDLAQWRSASAGMSLTARLIFLADAGGFRERWHDAPEYERARLACDLERIAAAATQMAAANREATFGDLEQALEAQVLQLAPARRFPGAIVVDSIVAIKGLRYEHVFVCGVAHERFPRIYTSHAMAFSRTYGLIVRENVARGAAQTAKFAWYYSRFGAKSLYLDEERRALAYGLSRARRGATATGFGVPPRWAKDQDLLASLEADGPETSEEGGTTPA